MKKVKITVMRMACYHDLMEQYENLLGKRCGPLCTNLLKVAETSSTGG